MLELKDHLAPKSNQVIARRRPGNKGRRYPADPPRVEEIWRSRGRREPIYTAVGCAA